MAYSKALCRKGTVKKGSRPPRGAEGPEGEAGEEGRVGPGSSSPCSESTLQGAYSQAEEDLKTGLSAWLGLRKSQFTDGC